MWLRRIFHTKVLLCYCVIALVVGYGCAPTEKEDTPTTGALSVEGSESAFPLLSALADTFMKLYVKSKIDVKGSGSKFGVSSLFNKEARIAVLSRELDEEEKRIAKENKLNPISYKIAVDGVAFIVNKDNPLEELTLEKVEKIFTGEIADWKDVAGKKIPILVVTRNENSGTYGFVKSFVLKNKEYTKDAYKVNTTDDVLMTVENQKNAIGYVSMTRINSKVKVLGISMKEGEKSFLPNLESAYYRTYPVLRFIYLYTLGEAEGLASGFISYITSTEGQKIVAKYGYLPATVPVKPRGE